MPEQEPQFFKPEERKIEGGEAETRLGKKAETEIADPLFKELVDEKIIKNAWKTSPEVDSKQKVDFILEFSEGNYLAIDTCIARAGAERWTGKIKEWGDNPLRTLGQIHPEYEKKYERFLGSHEELSRTELMAIQKERAQLAPQELDKLKEKIPMLFVHLNGEEVENAFDKFNNGEAQTVVDALYNKETMKLNLLKSVALGLSQYLTNEEFIKQFKIEKLQSFMLPKKYEKAVRGVETFFQQLQEDPEKLGHTEAERRVTIEKTSQFLEEHQEIIGKQGKI